MDFRHLWRYLLNNTPYSDTMFYKPVTIYWHRSSQDQICSSSREVR